MQIIASAIAYCHPCCCWQNCSENGNRASHSWCHTCFLAWLVLPWPCWLLPLPNSLAPVIKYPSWKSEWVNEWVTVCSCWCELHIKSNRPVAAAERSNPSSQHGIAQCTKENEKNEQKERERLSPTRRHWPSSLVQTEELLLLLLQPMLLANEMLFSYSLFFSTKNCTTLWKREREGK